MPVVQNKGRLANFVTGITGVAAGGQAVVNMPTNLRYHRVIFQCAAVNYTGGTGETTVTLTGAGTGATVTPTIVNGVITSAAVVSGGSGYAVNDTIAPVDFTGQGAILRVATVSSGAILTFTVTSGGSASPINPVTMITSIKLLVNGINMRDITPASLIGIAQANGYYPSLGELPLFFTEPWRNMNHHNEVTSWDMFGQSTFQIQIGVSGSVVNPSVVGVQEFDYQRNASPKTVNGQSVLQPFLQPTSQHQFSWPIVGGRNDINTLPFSYPISRLFLLGSSPGNIYQFEVYQDSNKVLEATVGSTAGAVINGLAGQMNQLYREYGFDFTATDTPARNGPATSYNPNQYFDAAFISDPDQRYWKALKCANSFTIRVYSNVAQTLTIVEEMLPGAYSS